MKRGLRPKGGGGFSSHKLSVVMKKKPSVTAFGGATSLFKGGLIPSHQTYKLKFISSLIIPFYRII